MKPLKKRTKIIKSKSKWINPSVDHPSDQLKVRIMINEKIEGDRIIGLEAKINPGHIHQLHFHQKEFVIVYSIKGKCKVTIGDVTQTVFPKSMIFIPPKIPHRFENKWEEKWEGIAFAVGKNSKIKSEWLE